MSHYKAAQRECVPGFRLSYLNGMAWRVPTWYRTKMIRARKEENLRKPMMPVYGEKITQGRITSLPAPTEILLSLDLNS